MIDVGRKNAPGDDARWNRVSPENVQPPMRRILLLVMAVVATLLFLWLGWAPSWTKGSGAVRRSAPDFPTRDPNLWINSTPLSIGELKGAVVVIDVWT